MKRFIALSYIIGTLASGFVPMYIVDKYTERHADGSFVNLFGVVRETEVNRAAADQAQQKFAKTFGR